MARRSPGAPQVIAYWWKSPSRARCAASTTAAGGAKFGIPWARLTPPYWSQTRVISRITDSVNPCTLLEIPADITTVLGRIQSRRRRLGGGRGGGREARSEAGGVAP